MTLATMTCDTAWSVILEHPPPRPSVVVSVTAVVLLVTHLFVIVGCAYVRDTAGCGDPHLSV